MKWSSTPVTWVTYRHRSSRAGNESFLRINASGYADDKSFAQDLLHFIIHSLRRTSEDDTFQCWVSWGSNIIDLTIRSPMSYFEIVQAPYCSDHYGVSKCYQIERIVAKRVWWKFDLPSYYSWVSSVVNNSLLIATLFIGLHDKS